MSQSTKIIDRPTPAGYVLQDLEDLPDLNLPGGGHLKLLLPLVVQSELVAEKEAARELRLEKRSDERAAERLREIQADERRRQQPLYAHGPGELDQQSVMEKRDALLAKEEAAQANPRQWRQIYALKAVEHMLDTAKRMAVDKDIRKRDEELGKRLLEIGQYRKIAGPGALQSVAQFGTVKKRKRRQSAASALKPLQHIHQAFDDLRVAHPHFTEVIDFVCRHLVLASQSPLAIGLPPILLDGEPGVGKTHFSFELAEALGTSYERVAFDTPVTAATLMGSDRRWANTEFGLLFRLVCLGQYANPVIVLDEIDKAVSQRNSSPLEPLHTLLEPITAQKLRDVSVNFEFDASMVSWIATSNNSRCLPPAILSRFTKFEICRPDAAGALASAKAVLQKAFTSLGLVNFDAPGRDMVAALAHLTPREVIQNYKQAVATALTKGKRCADPYDLPPGIYESSPAVGPDKPTVWLH